MMLQPRDSGGDEGGGDTLSPMAMAEAMCNDILDVVRDIKFPVEDIQRSLSDEEKGPYQFVFLQECTYMGALTGEMLRSLLELQLGFKGELTMSAPTGFSRVSRLFSTSGRAPSVSAVGGPALFRPTGA